jgi:hypothetical protein
MQPIELKPKNAINLSQQRFSFFANDILKVVNFHFIKDVQILITHGLHDDPVIIRINDKLASVAPVRLARVPDVLQVVLEVQRNRDRK